MEEEIKKFTSDKLMLPLSIIIAGLLIGAGVYFNGKFEQETAETVATQNREVVTGSSNLKGIIRPVDANDHVLGSPEARIVIVEYSDPECPFCKVFHSTMQAIMQEYGAAGKVAWVYRHYPVPELHSKAQKEAEALECAAELGGNTKFWEYTNKLYEVTPSNDDLPTGELGRIATQVGLSTSAFNTCLESGQYAPRVGADAVNAQELGALGTPYSVIIDTKTQEYFPIDGAYPYLQMKQVVDLILES